MGLYSRAYPHMIHFLKIQRQLETSTIHVSKELET